MALVYSVDEQARALFVRDLLISAVFVEDEECRGTAFPRTVFFVFSLMKLSIFLNYCLVSALIYATASSSASSRSASMASLGTLYPSYLNAINRFAASAAVGSL